MGITNTVTANISLGATEQFDHSDQKQGAAACIQKHVEAMPNLMGKLQRHQLKVSSEGTAQHDKALTGMSADVDDLDMSGLGRLEIEEINPSPFFCCQRVVLRFSL